jgi:hypothetical protein
MRGGGGGEAQHHVWARRRPSRGAWQGYGGWLGGRGSRPAYPKGRCWWATGARSRGGTRSTTGTPAHGVGDAAAGCAAEWVCLPCRMARRPQRGRPRRVRVPCGAATQCRQQREWPTRAACAAAAAALGTRRTRARAPGEAFCPSPTAARAAVGALRTTTNGCTQRISRVGGRGKWRQDDTSGEWRHPSGLFHIVTRVESNSAQDLLRLSLRRGRLVPGPAGRLIIGFSLSRRRTAAHLVLPPSRGRGAARDLRWGCARRPLPKRAPPQRRQQRREAAVGRLTRSRRPSRHAQQTRPWRVRRSRRRQRRLRRRLRSRHPPEKLPRASRPRPAPAVAPPRREGMRAPRTPAARSAPRPPRRSPPSKRWSRRGGAGGGAVQGCAQRALAPKHSASCSGGWAGARRRPGATEPRRHRTARLPSRPRRARPNPRPEALCPGPSTPSPGTCAPEP